MVEKIKSPDNFKKVRAKKLIELPLPSSIQTLLSVLEFHQVSHISTARGLYRRSGITPCPEDMFIFYIFIIHSLMQNFNSYFFMVKEILPLFSSISKTLTSTISPTLTTSKGCFTNLSDNWLICTNPS